MGSRQLLHVGTIAVPAPTSYQLRLESDPAGLCPLAKMGVGGPYVWGGTAFKARVALVLCNGPLNRSEANFHVPSSGG
jgi:hypothetical protein